MATVLAEIELDADATLTVLRHEDSSVSWQLELSTVDDLRRDDGGDPVMQCQRQAVRYLASVIKDLEQDIVA